jgi:3',5'-cyclic AMP phosphodiesterase CpdA
MKFIHLSDLHIHTHDSDNTAVRAMFDFIEEKYPEHRLIITGDIADDGAVRQFENAHAFLKPFKDRVFICPGNHDFGAAGYFYSHERALCFDEILAKPLNQGGTFKGDTTPVVNMLKDGDTQIMLIALDSNLETEHPFDFACGEIGEPQLNALNTILKTTTSEEVVKILYFHHHPFMVNNPFMEMKDAASLARTIYGRVDLVLFGHKHEMRQWEKRWATKYILASDNSPGKKFAKEITIDIKGIRPPVEIPIARGASTGKSQTAGKNRTMVTH